MKKTQLISDLVSVASTLDLANLKREADIVDGIIKKLAWDLMSDPVFEAEQAEKAKANQWAEEDATIADTESVKRIKLLDNNKKAQTQLNKILDYQGKEKLSVDGKTTPAQMALFKEYSGDYKSWAQLFKGLSDKFSEITNNPNRHRHHLREDK